MSVASNKLLLAISTMYFSPQETAHFQDYYYHLKAEDV